MTVDVQSWKKKRRKLWLATAVVAALLAIVVVPPLVSIGRYKSRITHLMSESLGRPVRLSSVELRLFPRPGFVLTDLTVEEDPAYGAEPVLHAETVTASIRLLSLWRGRLEIGTISVDNASLNVVRTAGGRWNLDPLFRTAAARAEPAAGNARPGRRATPLPYLEATNSRINFKRGAEKLPFSLVATDLSFWQEQPGDWRIRLRGQPARTDLSLDLADTGLVRLEARAQSATELRKVPLHVDLEWREAQLGQLMRLVIGSDPGWRGDLTGELHLDGTPDAAQIQTRLRATGVHRAEFAPAAPMDFDASCGFLYHFSLHAAEKLACDSPLGDGRIHLAGELPENGALPHFSVEVDRIPVAAGLDALRTVRSGFGPGLEVAGTISGKMTYATSAPEGGAPNKRAHKVSSGNTRPAAQGPLTGSFTVEGLQVSGDGLSTPFHAAKLVLEPAPAPPGQPPGEPPALVAIVAIPAGGAGPLTVASRLTLAGYQVTVRGQASIARVRELAHAAGLPNAAALDGLAGEPVTVDLTAEGPWSPPAPSPPTSGFGSTPFPGCFYLGIGTRADTLTGTVTLRNANWKANYLANPIEISQATLHLNPLVLSWAPVVFSYGPVKGTAFLSLPAAFDASSNCPPEFHLLFDSLDAGALQAAILGAHERGTLLSELIARFSPAATPAWPPLGGTVRADSLVLGAVTLRDATSFLRVLPSGAEIISLEASLLGGKLHGVGTLHAAGSGEDKPAYTLEGHFEKLSPAAVGQLLGLKWSGGVFQANGKIDLSGFTGTDLAASAKGTLHFDWRHGGVAAQNGASSEADAIPEPLTRFDRWTADADIANGTATLKDNEVQQGARKRKVEGALTFGDPPKVSFAAPKETQARR